MTWTDIRRSQPDILKDLKRDFPHLKTFTLRRGGADWVALVVSFAAAHELTFAEGREILQDWLSRRSPDMVLKAA